MVALPAFFPTTFPSLSTVAMELLVEAQWTALLFVVVAFSHSQSPILMVILDALQVQPEKHIS